MSEREVEEILRDTYTPNGIAIWLASRNRNLGMQIPGVLIAVGRSAEVLEEARRVAGS